ncbi:MAG: hypothetical protein DI537_13940 [Stutzerimonas stutzeri]|nr:MAG: hypothetical protein DI537_13940 [Stutzerimonas stutzeri]
MSNPKAPSWDLRSSEWQVDAYWPDGAYKEPLAYTTTFFAAEAAYRAALTHAPYDRIIFRQRARVIRKSWEEEPMDQPKADAYAKALARIQELTGCLEDTPEEAELIALTEAVQRFEEALKHLVEQVR